MFDGNINHKTVKTVVLPCAVEARYIRFVPKSYAAGGGIAMRVDVLGCDIISASRKFISHPYPVLSYY